MRRLYIVVEGQTEEAFVNRILAPYLYDNGLSSVTPAPIHRGNGARGGMVDYQTLRRDVLRYLKESDAPIVSTLIDFFRIPETPGKAVWEKATNHHKEAELREQEMRRDMQGERDGDTLGAHFIPYIQLHEFEALLFSSDVAYGELFPERKAEELREIVSEYEDPEMINTTPEGAPSKRFLRIVSDYDKVVHGSLIAEAIGIQAILARCPRFRSWVERLIEACTDSGNVR